MYIVLIGHAIKTTEVAVIGNGDPQVIMNPVVSVEQHDQ